MTKEEIIRNLKYTMEKHKNDTIYTFGTNISVMCKDILDYFEEQEPTKREIEREYLFQSLCEDFKKLQAENDDLRKRLKQEPITTTNNNEPITIIYPTIVCDDAISREAVLSKIKEVCFSKEWTQFRVNNGSHGQRDFIIDYIEKLPPVTQKSGKCKNCKYFEYDSVAKVDEVPLIVAHEICNKWGNGCKTSEDGYCYLFEPQESEDKE